jgi:hypothetical protein
MIGGGVAGFLVLTIVAMLIMLKRRKGRGGKLDSWDADSAQLAAGGYVAGQPAAPAPSPFAPVAQTAASYADLPAGGSYVTDAAGGTWYNAPDGGQWALQGDGSFIKN